MEGQKFIPPRPYSTTAIKFIKDGCPTSHPCRPLLDDITTLVRRMQKVDWLHTLHKANSVADCFAKKGQGLPAGVHLFDRPLLNVKQALPLCL
ncbi:hypothetical protein AHAS_Ahas14G0256400 [Arachis hypogaea]